MLQSELHTPARMDIPLEIAIHTETDIFDELHSEWNDLLENSASDDVFLTREWHMTWWDAYHPGQLWVISCRNEENKLIGIAPWFLDDEHVVRMIGCEDVTDYLDVIVDQSYAQAVYDALAAFLAEHRQSFSAVNLCNIPEASHTHTAFAQSLEENGFSTDVETVDVCPIITLPEDWDGYLKHLDKKQRHEVRRKLRRAYGSNHDIQFYTVDSSDDLDTEIEHFLSLMAASDAEKAEFLQDEQNVYFFNQIIPLAMEQGWLRLTFLNVDGEPAAAYLNFEYKNRLLVYNSGFDLENHGAISPGIVLLSHNIREAIERGNEAFDLLRGDEAYKYRMGGVDTKIYRLKATSQA